MENLIFELINFFD